jgi:hypothetical protein
MRVDVTSKDYFIEKASQANKSAGVLFDEWVAHDRALREKDT